MRKRPQNTQEMLPGYDDYRREREQAIENRVNTLMKMWNSGMSGEALFTTQILICCGLPINETSASRVVRKARLADGNYVRVTFIRTSDLVPLPFRSDRTMLYFLTHKAVLQQSPLLKWEYANEYMHLFDLNPESGAHYRAAQERFTRVAYMDILVEYLDKREKVVEHWKCPLIDNARISVDVDGEGNWKPSRSISDMLSASQHICFGYRFYAELQKNPIPVPIELLRATSKSHRLMDYVVFLYWRAFAGKTESFIPWPYLQEQFDNSDTNPWRWAQNFKKAVKILKALPDPISLIQASVSERGVIIQPLPVGTVFFEGQPKLGFRKTGKLL